MGENLQISTLCSIYVNFRNFRNVVWRKVFREINSVDFTEFFVKTLRTGWCRNFQTVCLWYTLWKLRNLCAAKILSQKFGQIDLTKFCVSEISSFFHTLCGGLCFSRYFLNNAKKPHFDEKTIDSIFAKS